MFRGRIVWQRIFFSVQLTVGGTPGVSNPQESEQTESVREINLRDLLSSSNATAHDKFRGSMEDRRKEIVLEVPFCSMFDTPLVAEWAPRCLLPLRQDMQFWMMETGR